MSDSLTTFLAHHGVKGMRWGRRKESTSDSVPSRARVKEVHPDAAKAQEAKTKVKKTGVNSLSNKELQEFITRQNLEQQYARLSPAKQNVGKKFVTGIIANTGKQIASQYASEYAKKGIDVLIKSATSK